jgi:Ca2+-binding EF-hand superfamily protein
MSVVAVAMCILAGCAAPQARHAEEGSPDYFFARYDTNRDGVVSWDEAQQDPDLVRVFERADENHDGVLTRAEFENAARLAVKDRRAGAAAAAGE